MAKPMPTIFFGHGSPMNALEHNRYTEMWHTFGESLPRPRAILTVSAHWYINASAVTSMAVPRVIHDFYGFPEPLYRLRYAAPGSPALASRVRELLKQHGDCAGIDGTRGLDHGAWSQLLHMYPDADVPVAEGPQCAGNTVGYVVDTLDGDTIEVVVRVGSDIRTEKVRMLGVDTPETHHPRKPVQCFGAEAAAFTAARLPPGTPIRLETDVEARDKYGRLLAHVLLGGRRFGEELLRLGDARLLVIPPNGAHARAMLQAELEARVARRGRARRRAPGTTTTKVCATCPDVPLRNVFGRKRGTRSPDLRLGVRTVPVRRTLFPLSQ